MCEWFRLFCKQFYDLCISYTYALAQHIFRTGYNIYFAAPPSCITGYTHMDFVIKEAIEIKLHPNTFNKDNSFIINQFGIW
jgi:hypothetical protein